MLKFISAVIAAAAFAGVLTLVPATSTRLDAGPTAPKSSPFTQTAPTLAATAVSPELVRLEVARDLAAMRDSIDQLASKQEQLAQNIATLAAEQDIIHTRSSPPLSEAISPPPRKKARRVTRELVAQSSSRSTPAFVPQ
jgi:hypothetical protein